MEIIDRFRKKINDVLIDHPKGKLSVNITIKVFVTVLSCFIFAYGFRAFIVPTSECVEGWFQNDPAYKSDYITPLHLISGGASGFSQVIIRTVEIFADISSYEKIITSVLYILINVPLLILAFKKISKQFAFFTLLNVACVSLFNYIIPDVWIYKTINIYEDTLARCICGGLTTGISSGLAMIIGTSAGGADILSVYISEKKSATAGKYGMYINACIITLYTLVSVIGSNTHPEFNTVKSSTIIALALYSIVYYFVSSKVVDIINYRNKKQEIQIFTSDKNLSQVLIRTFPHACTIISGKGAYSGEEKLILYMVVSKKEAKKAIKFIRQEDPNSFITVSELNQVYGRFYIKPLD